MPGILPSNAPTKLRSTAESSTTRTFDIADLTPSLAGILALAGPSFFRKSVPHIRRNDAVQYVSRPRFRQEEASSWARSGYNDQWEGGSCRGYESELAPGSNDYVLEEIDVCRCYRNIY